jgi:hypothetical protein
MPFHLTNLSLQSPYAIHSMYRTASAGGILDAVLVGAIYTIVVGGARKWQLAEQREL